MLANFVVEEYKFTAFYWTALKSVSKYRATKYAHILFLSLYYREKWDKCLEIKEKYTLPEDNLYKNCVLHAQLMSETVTNDSVEKVHDAESLGLVYAAAMASNKMGIVERLKQRASKLAISVDDAAVLSKTLDFYTMAQHAELAEDAFRKLKPDTFAYAQLIEMFVRRGNSVKALFYLDAFTLRQTQKMFNLRMQTYLLQGSHRRVAAVFAEMINAGFSADQESIRLILGSILRGNSADWFEQIENIFFASMNSLAPSTPIVLSVLKACAMHDVNLALQVHKTNFYACERGPIAHTVILTMFCKRNDMEK